MAKRTDEIALLINGDVLNDIFKYAFYAYEHFDSEIAGWAHYKEERGIYKLAPLTKQVASGAEVDNFPNDLLEDESYDISDMMVQWHSHVNMNVFWSGTDEKCIKDTLKLTKTLISIVVNIFGEYKCRVDSIVVGRQRHMVSLNKQITQECILQAYHSDKMMERDVLRKLKKPAPMVPVVQNISQNTSYGARSFNVKTKIIEFIPYNSNIIKRWNKNMMMWEHNWDESDMEDDSSGSPITNNNTDYSTKTYWIREREKVVSDNKNAFVYVGKDSTTDTELYYINGFEDFVIEWSSYGLAVNDQDYTVSELKKKFGLK